MNTTKKIVNIANNKDTITVSICVHHSPLKCSQSRSIKGACRASLVLVTQNRQGNITIGTRNRTNMKNKPKAR